MDSTRASGPRVLVIDDEQNLRDMLLTTLQKRGYDVRGAANADEAYALVEDMSFDIAICDIMMPGQDGLAVLSYLKKKSPAMEIIMATGHATFETAVEAMKNGAFEYIAKPYSMNFMGAVLEKALEHRRLVARVDHLEEVNRLKSEFTATMNHELRTPLASITGYVALLEKGIYGTLPEKPREILRRVEANAKSLLELINSVLDLSKLAAEQMPLSLQSFTLDDLIQEVIYAMEPLAKDKKLKLAASCPKEFWVSTDRSKLKQVLINLMGNAIKFTPTGSVSLTVKKGDEPPDVEVRIQDTGIGIAEKDFPLLFQEFKQLDSSDTRTYKGTGLGLAISKKLITLMGGTIQVESEPQKGSTFIIRLPMSKAYSALPQLGADFRRTSKVLWERVKSLARH